MEPIDNTSGEGYTALRARLEGSGGIIPATLGRGCTVIRAFRHDLPSTDTVRHDEMTKVSGP